VLSGFARAIAPAGFLLNLDRFSYQVNQVSGRPTDQTEFNNTDCNENRFIPKKSRNKKQKRGVVKEMKTKGYVAIKKHYKSNRP